MTNRGAYPTPIGWLGAKDDPMDKEFLDTPPQDLDNIEVLEQLGPGHCWPERFTEYHYTGE